MQAIKSQSKLIIITYYLLLAELFSEIQPRASASFHVHALDSYLLASRYVANSRYTVFTAVHFTIQQR
jgi:hypothetical protein